MRRRDFMALLGGATAGAAMPCAVRAQQPGRVARIGLLRVGQPPPSFLDSLRNALAELGRVEGRNYAFDFAIAERVDQLSGLAANLVRNRVDLIIASGSSAALPARNASSTVPVVFIAALDPVDVGLVVNLARPGGHVTGLTTSFSDLNGKRLELLKEMIPTLSRAALLSRPANPSHADYVQQTQAAARALQIELQLTTANTPDDFEAAFGRLQNVGALIQIDDAMFTAHRQALVDLALRHRLPGAYGLREFVELGGFMMLGPSFPDLYRRSASYVDRILKGAKPADLPVEQASKFETIVNLKTAKALGLTIAPALLARADEVIE